MPTGRLAERYIAKFPNYTRAGSVGKDERKKTMLIAEQFSSEISFVTEVVVLLLRPVRNLPILVTSRGHVGTWGRGERYRPRSGQPGM